MLYLFLLPAVLMIAVFCYAPMYGVLMAFQNYSPSKGITGSSWVGLKWFRTFFNMPRFWQIVKNTLTLSIYSLIAGFPIPVILALMINSVRNSKFQKVTQTVTYMPHFHFRCYYGRHADYVLISEIRLPQSYPDISGSTG